MSVDSEKVKDIAQLARIAVDDGDLEGYAANLTNILGLVEQMQGANTDDVEPMAHPLSLAQRLRDDEVSEPNRREDYQAVAPETENGLYLVPRVIE